MTTHQTPRRVILESPFTRDTPRHVAYARACMADSVARGEAPIAGHLLYSQPGVLQDVPGARAHVNTTGHAWIPVAEASVVYTDLGISKSMEIGILRARRAGIPVEYRSISRWDDTVDVLSRPFPAKHF